MNMSEWNRLELDVIAEIELDPRNVRLENNGDIPPDEIVAELFSHEQAMDIVKSIAANGWYRHELPIVLERDSGFVVAEGNRRLAALQAIQNPNLAPAFKSRILATVTPGNLRDSLRRIEVVVAPDQESADLIVANLHTRSGRRRWSRVNQTTFFKTKLSEGATIEELVSRYPSIDIRGIAKRVGILDLFRSGIAPESDLAAFAYSSRLPLTVLERLLRVPFKTGWYCGRTCR